MGVTELPPHLADLNDFEHMLIKKAKSNFTVYNLKTVFSNYSRECFVARVLLPKNFNAKFCCII